MKKRVHVFKAFLAKLLTMLMITLVLFPFLWILLSSLKYEKDIMNYPPKIFAYVYTLSQYEYAFRTVPLLRYMLNTVLFAGGVTLFSVMLDAMSGYAFARLRFRGSKIIYKTILLTLMIPFQVIMIPLFVEEFKLGLLNSYAGLILPRLSCAYGIFMMRTFFLSMPKNLEEAARIDGENEIGIFFRIMLPLAKSGMLALGIYLLMTNWNDLSYPLILSTDAQMRTLPAGIAMFVGNNQTSVYGPMMAATIVSVLPLLIIYLFMQKHFITGIALSGMKD